VSFGPNPWQQRHWDWRAAGNFICGGAGSGLIVCAALSAAPLGWLLAGAALVGIGLSSVWLEIGRPWRALHVVLNPRTSWMTREAMVALALFAAVGAAWLGVPLADAAAPLLALGFVFCQGRMLRAAKGIPAWREPRIVPLIVATGFAEGAGAWLLLVVVAFEVFVSRRFWCRYVCPGGALYSLLGRFRLVRLDVVESSCTSCEKCEPVCEFGLDPSKGHLPMECNNCGLCIRACAPRALIFKLGLPAVSGSGA